MNVARLAATDDARHFALTPTSPAAASGLHPFPLSPRRAVIALIVAHFAWWSLLLALGHRAPELDSAEQFAWSFSMESGYWKHPPLPSWLMHGLILLFGPSVALPSIATQAGVAIGLWFTWRLGCALMSPERALIGTGLTALVAYHGSGADSFNHTTVLLPLLGALVAAGHRALTRRELLAWAATGLLAGAAMLVKYIALLPIAALVAACVLDRRLYARRNLQGVVLAVAIVLLVLAPHALWLERVDFLPFRYARLVTDSAHGAAALRSAADFVLMQLLRLLPMLAVLGWLVRGASRPGTVPAGTAATLSAADLRFLAVNALGPITMTLAWGLVSGTALPSRWGGSAFLLSGLLAVALVRLPEGPAAWRRALAAVLVVELIVGLASTLPRALWADRLGISARANFPSDELAVLSHRVWKAHVPDRPLRLVVSDVWLGGNLVARSDRPLAVLIDGYTYRAPWIRPDAVAQCGALVLDDLTEDGAGHAEPQPALEALIAQAPIHGEWTLHWATPALRATRPEARGRVHWAVLPPTPGAPPCPL